MKTPLAAAALLTLLGAGAAPAAVAQAASGQPAGTPAAPAAAATAPAATRYVIEQLVVSVNSAADRSGTRIATLRSGDKVELLERSGEAAHVRLANGRDGWVPASYLSDAEPLRLQLAARSAEVAVLRQQLQALSAASARAAAPPVAASAAAKAPGTDETAPEADGDAGESHGVAWGWLIGTALICLACGFGAGWLVLDARIRRRYGGLRIY